MARKCKELTADEIAKAKEAKKQYMRKWRQENKDKVQAACLRYWARKAAEAEEAEEAR